MMDMEKRLSPCLYCTGVENPAECENKNCGPWRHWFICRWEQLRREARSIWENSPGNLGVSVGGRKYAAPHQVTEYLETDPCSQCGSPRNLCSVPCRRKRNWENNRKEILP